MFQKYIQMELAGDVNGFRIELVDQATINPMEAISTIERSLSQSDGQILNLEVLDMLGYFISFKSIRFDVLNQLQSFIFQTSSLHHLDMESLKLLVNLKLLKIESFNHQPMVTGDFFYEIFNYLSVLRRVLDGV